MFHLMVEVVVALYRVSSYLSMRKAKTNLRLIAVGQRNSTNYNRCSNDPDGFAYTDGQKFIPFDAYYNGTLKLQYTPNNASDSCGPYIADRQADLEIGQLLLASDNKISR